MERIGTLLVAPTAERKTEPGRFDTALRAAASGAADGLAATVSLAAPLVPGGMVLAGAVRGLAGAARGGAAPAPAAGLSGAALSGGDGDLLEATRALQQQSQSWNLQYLELQEAMQRESREFQAVSNVMKVKHDSAKAAINNVH